MLLRHSVAVNVICTHEQTFFLRDVLCSLLLFLPFDFFLSAQKEAQVFDAQFCQKMFKSKPEFCTKIVFLTIRNMIQQLSTF